MAVVQHGVAEYYGRARLHSPAASPLASTGTVRCVRSWCCTNTDLCCLGKPVPVAMLCSSCLSSLCLLSGITLWLQILKVHLLAPYHLCSLNGFATSKPFSESCTMQSAAHTLQTRRGLGNWPSASA